MITLITTSSTREIGESVLFQPVLKTYPTHHSWITTAHISLGHLECHWKYFSRQVDKTCQLLQFLSHWPAALTHLISPLQVELTTINDMYNSCKPTVISAINLLNTDPPFDGHVNSNKCLKRSLLPFLGDTLRWLTGTATTKDVNCIKEHVNQLTEAQSTQQEPLVLIWHHIIHSTSKQAHHKHLDGQGGWNISWCQQPLQLDYLIGHQFQLSPTYNVHQVSFSKPGDSVSYIRMVSTHTMDYIDAAMSGTLSPHILPIMDLKKMLSHIEETLPSTLHLPVSSEDTLHFYRYLCLHVLIANK